MVLARRGPSWSPGGVACDSGRVREFVVDMGANLQNGVARRGEGQGEPIVSTEHPCSGR